MDAVQLPGVRIGYARVSTAEQNATLQVQALTAARCVRVFTDTAPGALRSRPQLDAALDFVRAGDTVVVWRLDRLGRSLNHLIATIASLTARGIGLVSLREAIDTTTSSGRLVLQVFGSLAEFERELIIERTHAGLAAARAQGRTGGRPPLLSVEKLGAAQRLHAAGDSVTSIARTLGVSRATLYRHLKAVSVAAPVVGLDPA